MLFDAYMWNNILHIKLCNSLTYITISPNHILGHWEYVFDYLLNAAECLKVIENLKWCTLLNNSQCYKCMIILGKI